MAGRAGAPCQEKQTSLPEASGKEVVQRICTACHEIETVVGSRRTEIGWQQSVDDMIARGAEGSDEDMAAVVAYLTRYFGKPNVNTATMQDLEKILEFSEKQAQAIEEDSRGECGKASGKTGPDSLWPVG